MSFLKQVLSMESASNAVSITTEELFDSFEAVYSAESTLTSLSNKESLLAEAFSKFIKLNSLSLENSLTKKEYAITSSLLLDNKISLESNGDKTSIWKKILEALKKVADWFKVEWSKFVNWTEKTGDKLIARFSKLTDAELAGLYEKIKHEKGENFNTNLLTELLIFYSLEKKDPSLYKKYMEDLKALEKLDSEKVLDEASLVKLEELEKSHNENLNKIQKVRDDLSVMDDKEFEKLKEEFLSSKSFKRYLNNRVEISKLQKRTLAKVAKMAEKAAKANTKDQDEMSKVSRINKVVSNLKSETSKSVTSFYKSVLKTFNSAKDIFNKEKQTA